MIIKGSKVKIITGKDKNKEGEIIEIDRSGYRAKVKGMNLIKKHIKTTKEKKGGIFDKENFINLSNLKLLDGNKLKKAEVKK
ncbi:MAG: 50S ribosomal protein L24 [Candidatus Pelagibacter sp. TMED118]|nr:MAG: 50S ribosomal protein L24 [Candidatus Pelagibacter sp. TMED118]|tara:strand:+ start:1333 stop:1578 length:246 start_codon:yes stop_codon:yes gene_type:complete